MLATRDYTRKWARAQHKRDTEPFALNLPADKQYLQGCPGCDCGRILLLPLCDAWSRYPQAVTLPMLLLLMFRDGLYAHCDCDAGQVAARALEKAAADLEKQETAMRDRVGVMQQARLRRLFEAASVPHRYADLTIEGYRAIVDKDPGKQTAIHAVESLRRTGEVQTSRGPRFGLLLYGKSDMGKTGLLSPLFVEQVREGAAGLWVQYNDLLASLRDFESGEVAARINAAKQATVLFIDDFGDPAADRGATDYTRDVVFRILDHRNNEQARTYITTNLEPAKLAAQFHERIVKRLGELCAFVEVKGATMGALMESAPAKHWDLHPLPTFTR